MIAEFIDSRTGAPIKVKIAASSEEDIRDLLAMDLTDDALRARLDQLNISADAKSILFTIAKMTVRIGKTVVQLGRKILDLILGFLTDFPGTSTGVIFGAVFGLLVSSIPVVGLVMGPLVGKLAVAFGFAVGAFQDLSNKALEARIKASMVAFDPLREQV